VVDATREVEVEISEVPQGVAQAVEMAPTSTISLPPGSLPSLSCSTDVQPDDIGPPAALVSIAEGGRVFVVVVAHLEPSRAREEKTNRYDCTLYAQA